MYRIMVTCEGVLDAEGDEAATDIVAEFKDHRTHHSNVSGVYEDGAITLVAENDFDPDGLALLDEFGDCLAAYLSTWDGSVRVISVTEVAAP